jgi:hypothetical protein
LAQRSRIVLACASGLTNMEVAEQERVSAATVGKWRGRFVRERLDGLVDEPRARCRALGSSFQVVIQARMSARQLAPNPQATGGAEGPGRRRRQPQVEFRPTAEPTVCLPPTQPARRRPAALRGAVA